MKVRVELLAGLALALALGCGKSHKGGGAKVQVTRGDLKQIVQATGNVEPLNAVAILPPLTGRIDKILVLEGTYVKKGQVLAWMSSSDRAALLDMARSQGAAEIKYWESAYMATPIVSPSDGLIVSRNIVEGQTVGGTTDVYARRFTHETAVHRADAALAAGAEYDLDRDVALDAIDEWMELGSRPAYAETHLRIRELPGPGRTLHFHATVTRRRRPRSGWST